MNPQKLDYHSALENSKLVKLKLKAMRSGVWFKALRKIDRVLLDLTLKVSGKVRSTTLAKELFAVIARLENALENPVARTVNDVGFQLAQKISQIAQGLGNLSARNWATDLSFARFLAIMHLNNLNMP